MSTPSNAVPGASLGSRATATPPPSATRPMYWSVRRELWENRSLYVAPLAVAAVMLFGFLISAIGLPHRRRLVLMLNPAQQRAAIEKPYVMAAMMILVTVFIVGVFYCLDALHGERRDRSILFWKSLPVSDFTTVLAKASIPMVILPLIAFGIIVATQVDILQLTNAILLMNGMSGTTLDQVPLIQNSMFLLYGSVALALWHAPIYGWLLMVSAWARRATFLWAVLPFFAISIFETIAFRTSYFASLMRYRLIGPVGEAFASGSHGRVDSLSEITPERFLSTPGLWIGLVFAGAFLAAAVRLRRDRGPI
jgi:ABC-2 type transport system permease protein